MATREYLWPTEEQALLLTAAIAAEPQAIRAFEQWNRSVDYNKFFDTGVFRLLPPVYKRMSSLGVTADEMPRLKGVYQQAWCKTQILFRGVAPALALLHANHIEILLLKGAPLQSLYYKGAGLRPMSDVDIAIRRKDMAKSISLLRKAGWSVRERELQEFDESDTGMLENLLQQHHGFQFKSPDGHEIDLHNHLLKDAFTAAADDWFWNASLPYSFMGMQMRRLDATALLFHVIIHGVRPNLEPPVRWITDAHVILAEAKDEIRWEDMIELARRESLSHRLYLGLSYIAEQFAAPVPPYVFQELQAVRPGFTEWAERKYVFDLDRGGTIMGWIFGVLALEARRAREHGRLTFLARVGLRAGGFLRRRLISVLSVGDSSPVAQVK
jgi:hypothetical protein